MGISNVELRIADAQAEIGDPKFAAGDSHFPCI
jgi:hypothetical protein